MKFHNIISHLHHKKRNIIFTVLKAISKGLTYKSKLCCVHTSKVQVICDICNLPCGGVYGNHSHCILSGFLTRNSTPQKCVQKRLKNLRLFKMYFVKIKTWFSLKHRSEVGTNTVRVEDAGNNGKPVLWKGLE